MAEHLREQTIPEQMVAMADYYLRGVKRAEVAGTAAIPRQDMPMAVAQALGLDVTRTATHDEVVNLLQGRRADGEEIAGRQAYKVGPGKDRITYVDFTFSAPKSVSVAMALAPTDAERHTIVGAGGGLPGGDRIATGFLDAAVPGRRGEPCAHPHSRFAAMK